MNEIIERKTIKSALDTVFIAIDTETTGLSPKFNELIEVSAIKYLGNKKIDKFSTLIKPKSEIPYNITRITGITNDMVYMAPDIEEVMPKLIDFVGEHVLVAHNISFDMGFLKENSKGEFNYNETVDTVKISRKMHPGLPNHKLGTVAKHIGIEEEGFHRAEFDCECCAKIYMKYLGID